MMHDVCMKKIIKVLEKNPSYLDVVYRYDNGNETTATLTKSEYDAQVIKEKIFEFLSVSNVSPKELQNIMKQIEELEDLSYLRGSEAGYYTGFDQGR